MGKGKVAVKRIWKVQKTRKKNKRAMKGMVMKRREGIKVKRNDRQERKEGIMIGKASLKGDWWRLVGAYVNKDLKVKMEKLRRWMKNGDKGVKMVRGRILTQGRERKEESGREKGRKGWGGKKEIKG